MKDKTVRRCRIWIPLWRVDELEAWFSDMAEQGWELKGIKSSKAVFEKVEPRQLFFYCRIFDSIEEEYYMERATARAKEISDIEAIGWKHVTTINEVGIFINNLRLQRIIISDTEKEAKKHLRLYKNELLPIPFLLLEPVSLSIILLIDFLRHDQIIAFIGMNTINLLIITYILIVGFVNRRKAKLEIIEMYKNITPKENLYLQYKRSVSRGTVIGWLMTALYGIAATALVLVNFKLL